MFLLMDRALHDHTYVPKGPTWTPKVCKVIAFMAIIGGLGLLFYIFGGLGKP